MTESEFDRNVADFSEWRKKVSSNGREELRSTYEDGISDVSDAIYKVTGIPQNKAPYGERISLNPLGPQSHLTDNQKDAVFLGLIASRATEFLDDIVNRNIQGLDIDLEETNRSRQHFISIFEKLRSAYESEN